MASAVKNDADEFSRQIVHVLTERYKPRHRKAKIEAYRYNPASVRVRIIDPDFAGKSIPEREDEVWTILEGTLPEEIRSDISILLLITPKERKESFASMEFDDPTPARM
jgi:stress-induced morphogen